jgi:hypothetical protein
MKRFITSFVSIILLILSADIAFGQKASSTVTKEQLPVKLPLKDGSIKFAIIGDTGSGTQQQQELANVMARYVSSFPFEFVLMLGDNLYGSEKANDYKTKFENVYKRLLDNKVKFYATLGNHDQSNQRFYEHFNMDGKEYYSFKKGNVTFYSLNSNYMDKPQLKWLEGELEKDKSQWKICFFHHPLYSSGKKHGSNEELRKVVEPLFLKYKVNVVLAGHEHFYERIKPQKGIYHFISGAGGKLRPGDVKVTNLTDKSFDQDLHFMLVEIIDRQLHFQVISRTGETVDSGTITNQFMT